MSDTPFFRFELIHQSKRSRARVGRIHTPHGIIDTPNFVGVGTNGTLKAVDTLMTAELDLQLMFCNTYHLLLAPGPKVIGAAGGLHTFINRKQPIITDSGGFQVFSLAYGGITAELKSAGKKKQDGSVIKISEEGVLFRSYRDGSPILLTPESTVHAQKAFGADIIIPLDELPPYHITPEALRKSLDRTHRWEARSLAVHRASPQQQAMYAVIHGGVSRDMRKESCAHLSKLPFDGFAIGGSMGCTRKEMAETVGFTTPHLPPEMPNHLLGIADLESIEYCVPFGIDTFDSAYPTRSARHGVVFTEKGLMKLKPNNLSMLFEPIEAHCDCYTCKNYTVAYLHHLFKARESVMMTLASIHNIAFMVRRMAAYRQAILEDRI